MSNENKAVELTDDKNPIYLFSITHTDLLVKIVNGEIDALELAKQQLKSRGLNDKGLWVGFN